MPFEQIPLFEESPGAGKAVIVETAQEKAAREAAEAKAAFAHMHEVVDDSLTWEQRVRMGLEGKPNLTAKPERKRFARRLTKPTPAPLVSERLAKSQKESWSKDHEAQQDERPVRYGPDAVRG